jgi:uncharacterized protein
LYSIGSGVPQDAHKAAQWRAEAARSYRKSADRGDADAQRGLANLYLLGEGVPTNDAKSTKWFQKAADIRATPTLRKKSAMRSRWGAAFQ